MADVEIVRPRFGRTERMLLGAAAQIVGIAPYAGGVIKTERLLDTMCDFYRETEAMARHPAILRVADAYADVLARPDCPRRRRVLVKSVRSALRTERPDFRRVMLGGAIVATRPTRRSLLSRFARAFRLELMSWSA
jgi:hypothetical protein